ncbi:hypothetical protein POPTR_004G225350v4 [Populus trichocarpa]|uniref:Transmembrane protein n=1 Tax=Populus trichocarpa TaxID=3694 RepID=A0A3N7EUQ8_POPTR|nr:hypothetical protein BDE02_04G192300 [Populus trichocarpa]RQO89706.1 hypothetical protein POPTR_004G225350v4 [Populus trichocarpa]
MAREQLLELIMSSTTAMHAAMCFLNFVLLALLQLKYPNKGMSLFEEHGTIILLYIVTSFVYSTALIALLQRAHQLLETLFLVTLEYISLLSGVLTCDLLLLILAPPFGYFLLALCGVLILVKALLRSYQQILGHLLDIAAISEIARDLIPNVFHRSSRHQEAHIQAYSMVSPSMNRVSTNHNSTDQGGGDHNTTQTVGV